MLVDLPAELILQIGYLLPRDAIVALRLVHQRFSQIFPPLLGAPKQTDQCVRFAIQRHIENPSSSHFLCSICKKRYPRGMFRCSDGNSASTCAADMLRFPEGVCSWHFGRVSRVIKTDPGGANKWKSRAEDMCMHCGSIKAWFGCSCQCDSCGYAEIQTFTRFLNNERECRKFSFHQLEDDQRGTCLVVREMCGSSELSP